MISSNEFRGVNGLLPPYNGQFPYLNTMFAGIQAFDLNTLNLVSSSSSNPNLFQDLHNGVLMSNSGLIAQNNEFTDLIGNYTDLSSLNVFRGVGIGVLSTFDKLNIRNTLIDNCHGGIFAHNIRSTNVDITENILENCNFNTFSFGIKLQNGFLSPVNISDNFSLNNNRDAIVLSNIDFSNINISNNQQMNDNKNAISVFLCNPFFSTASITSNYISNSTLNNANGITINGCDLISVKDNIIDNNTNSGLGIAIGNSFACLIHNNIVNGGGEGLSVTLSSSGTYSCNSLSGALRGIDVLGANINSTVKTNTLSNGPSAYDIALNSTEIGQQPRHGNIFVGNSRAFINGNSNPIFNQFTYNPNDAVPIMGGAWLPTTVLPSTVTNWFVTNFDGGNELCMNNNVPQPLITGLENIANGISSISSFADQHLWSTQWQLMQLISQDPSLLNNTSISNFYYSNANVIQYYNIHKQIEELYYPTANEISSFESLKINLDQKKNELDVILSGVSESTYETSKGIIATKSQEIESISDQINVIKDAINQRAYNQAVSLKNAVSSLNEPSLFCADFKTTFNAALDVVIYGDATAKTTYDIDLIDLAESCVLEKGIPVLQAIALCETLNLIYVPHQNDCIDNRNKKEAPGSESKEILVYPVPSSNIIVLLNVEEIGQITISNKSGIIVREINSLKKESQISIDISTLQEGLYIVQCHNTMGNVSHHKIIKI